MICLYITTRVVAAQSKVLHFQSISILVRMSEFKLDLCILKEITNVYKSGKKINNIVVVFCKV